MPAYGVCIVYLVVYATAPKQKNNKNTRNKKDIPENNTRKEKKRTNSLSAHTKEQMKNNNNNKQKKNRKNKRGPGLYAVVLVANPSGLGSTGAIGGGGGSGFHSLSLSLSLSVFLAGQYQFIKISVCFVIYERWLVWDHGLFGIEGD